MERIGVLTSGGDASGMNACIRAVVRTAVSRGVAVVGIRRGYDGLIRGDAVPMDAESVGGILNRGGTLLYTARSSRFLSREGQQEAVDSLSRLGIEGLVIIGGEGSLRGARALGSDWGVPVVGVPATIDNDVAGTDFAIGFDTAVNVALEAIDKIRDTAASHERVFVIEVMGREVGFIALEVGLAGGAEAILLPEVPVDLDAVSQRIVEGRRRGKTSSIIVVAEGCCSAVEVGRRIHERTGLETRETILGHIQRGGTPTARDRVLAARLGHAAVEQLLQGRRAAMVGVSGSAVQASDIDAAWKIGKTIDLSLYRLAQVLAI
ncbi:MAG: 6-phosphofructokinase [Armatimonadetes bacterium]|nr:6-phosphofructokinase [Armatimonadota bacterium]